MVHLPSPSPGPGVRATDPGHATSGRSASPRTFFRSRSRWGRGADALALSVLIIIALIGFRTVYGGAQYLVTGIVAMLLGLLIALAGARWSWGPLRIALAVVLVHLALGTPFAAPSRALWGVVPTLGSLLELLVGPVRAWKTTLTMAPPVGSTQGVLMVAWISVLLTSVLAYSIALRTRRAALAWMLPFLLLGVTVVFGTTEATAPVLRGIAFAVVSIAWLSWRFESARLSSVRSTIISDSSAPGSWKNPVLRRRVIGGALVLALAAGTAVALREHLDPPEGTARYALRDRIVPPFDPFDYTSPLAQFRGYRMNDRETTLFTVSGARPGELMPLATLDDYDTEVFRVAGSADKDSASGAFLRTAAGVDLAGDISGTRTATVTVADYDRVWMPRLGERTTRVDPQGTASVSIAENLFYNQASGTLADRSGLATGESYGLTYVPYAEPSRAERDRLRFDDETAADLPALPALDPKVRALAQEWMGGARTDFGRMVNLTTRIKSHAYFSHGLEGETVSPPGHDEFRLVSMLEDEPGFDSDGPAASPVGLIGDQEQLAALMAVLARSAGIPARVVMGFEVPEGSGDIAVTGDNATAWVEVKFRDRGWVRFDPTPDEDLDPTQPEEKPIDQPKPQVAQPPPPPVEPPRLPPEMVGETGDRPEPEPEPEPAWKTISLLVGAPVLGLALLLALIVLVKAMRRRRRRLRGPAHRRIGGGWVEILDRATDLGVPPPSRATRREAARHLSSAFPQAELEEIARRADRGVFGPEDMAQSAITEYWGQIRRARTAMGRERSVLRRLVAAVSLRSLRPRRYTRRARARAKRTRRGSADT